MPSQFGSGKLNAYLDDFRFWKQRRTGRQIRRWYSSPVGGGTNDNLSNITLGVYYKFNEGIFGDESYDSNILDYSGRTTNAKWYGKPTATTGITPRYTTSAIFEATGRKEEKDPVIYALHPDVLSLRESKRRLTSTIERDTTSQLWTYLPQYIIEENKLDDPESTSDMKSLLNILGSYFDELFLQIEAIKNLKNIDYDNFKNTPAPFVKRMLEHAGLESGEIFIDASIHELLHAKNDVITYERNLQEVKNLIYKNIYNNLNYIYKTKGTMAGFKNLIRCFGIDEEILKINLYASDTEYKLEDDYKKASIRKKYVDFDDDINKNATIVLTMDATNNQGTAGVIGPLTLKNTSNNSHASKAGLAFSMETEFVLPKSSRSAGITSLFGYYQTTTPDDYNVIPTLGNLAADSADIQVLVEGIDSDYYDGARFKLKYRIGDSGAGTTGEIVSPFYADVFDDTKWNFAFSVAPVGYPFASDDNHGLTAGYVITFMGVQSDTDVIVNEFTLEKTITTGNGVKFLNGNKRPYLGAIRSSFAPGSAVVTQCAAKPGHLRAWLSKLEPAELKQHAIKPLNYGVDNPTFNVFPVSFESDFSRMNKTELVKSDTLMLNWDFSEVTTSDASGNIWIPDFASGSAPADLPDTGALDKIYYRYGARGFGFAASSTDVIDKRYIFAGKLVLPESVSSDNTIRILTQDDVNFTMDSKPRRMFLAIEKSMYQNISEEMLKMFHSISEFGTVVGLPVNKYRPEYKEMGKLREIFYRNIENTPDLERYIEFYKWFDRSLSQMLKTLTPATADSDLSIKTMIESHVLERNKYQHKFPSLAAGGGPPETIIRGHAELNYNWRLGHAPVGITAEKVAGTPPTLNASIQIQTPAVGNELVIEVKPPFTIDNTTAAYTVIVRHPTNALGAPASGQIFIRKNDDNTLVASYLIGAINQDPSQKGTKYDWHADVDSAVNLKASVGSTGAHVNLSLRKAPVEDNPSQPAFVRSATHGATFIVAPGQDNSQTGKQYFTGGLAPSALEDSNCLWWKERAERYDKQSGSQVGVLATGGHNNIPANEPLDIAREELREALVYQSINAIPGKVRERNSLNLDNTTGKDVPKLVSIVGDVKTKYEASPYFARRLNKHVKLTIDRQVELLGGSNFHGNKKHTLYRALFSGQKPTALNLMLLDFGETFRALYDHKCDDEANISWKRRLHVPAYINNSITGEEWDADSNLIAPFSIYERANGFTATAGARKDYAGALDGLKVENNLEITNLHSDSYGDDRAVPIQGPFTNEYVGGLQHRHVKFGDFPPSANGATETRPGAWQLVKNNKWLTLKAIDFTTTPAKPRHLYSRDEIAKRSVNIKNIKDSRKPSSLPAGDYYQIMERVGNYDKDYQILQINGRDRNNRDFIKNNAAYSDLTTYPGFLNSPCHHARAEGNTDYSIKVVFGKFGRDVRINEASDNGAHLPSEIAVLPASGPSVVNSSANAAAYRERVLRIAGSPGLTYAALIAASGLQDIAEPAGKQWREVKLLTSSMKADSSPLRVSFDFIAGTVTPAGPGDPYYLEKPDADDFLYFQYKLGAGWITLASYPGGVAQQSKGWCPVEFIVSVGQTAAQYIQFRWVTTFNANTAYDHWALRNIEVIKTEYISSPANEVLSTAPTQASIVRRPPGLRNDEAGELVLNNNSIIVERFSSPGSRGVNSLDRISAQYSAYNAIPYRNIGSNNALNASNSVICYGEEYEALQLNLNPNRSPNRSTGKVYHNSSIDTADIYFKRRHEEYEAGIEAKTNNAPPGGDWEVSPGVIIKETA